MSGPVILLGNPADNPLIAKAAAWSFLPYPVTADFPGRGRGYLAWQFDAVGIGQDSITVIATDAEGMSEAVGSIYEAAAGIDPLMRMRRRPPARHPARRTLAFRASPPPGSLCCRTARSR